MNLLNKSIFFFFFFKALINIYIYILKAGKIESVSRNIRVKLPEKDEDEVSNDEMDDDVIKYIYLKKKKLFFVKKKK